MGIQFIHICVYSAMHDMSNWWALCEFIAMVEWIRCVNIAAEGALFATATAFIFDTYFSLIPFFCFFLSKYKQCHWASYELSEMHLLYQKMCEAFIDLQWPKISRIYDINWSSSLWIRRIKQLQTRIIFFLVLIIKLYSIPNLTARHRNIVIKPNRSFFSSLLMHKNLIFSRSPDVSMSVILHSNKTETECVYNEINIILSGINLKPYKINTKCACYFQANLIYHELEWVDEWMMRILVYLQTIEAFRINSWI